MDNRACIYEKNRSILGRIVPLESPLSIIIDISEACNLKCSYCFRSSEINKNDSYVWKNNLMTMDVFEKVIDQISEFKKEPLKISLSGHGEPMVNKNLPIMVKRIKEKFSNVVVEIHTNATLLTEEYSNDLINSEIDKINISLQGLDEKSYKEIGGVELNYRNFIRNISYFYNNKKNTKVNIQIIEDAVINRESELYRLFGNISDGISINKIVPIWNQLEEKYSEMEDDKNKYGKQISYQKACSLLFYTLFITPEGDILPCTEPTITLNLGNIRNVRLKDAWESKERLNFLYKHVAKGRTAISSCKNCYIAQNSIMTEEDSLNDYVEEIKAKMEKYI